MTVEKYIKIREVLIKTECEDTYLEYKIMRYLKRLEEVWDFYVKKVKDIFEEYGDKDEDNNLIMDDKGGISITNKDNKTRAEKRIVELNNMEIHDIPNTMFTLDELSKLKLGRSELFVLDDIIENKEGSE